MTTTFSASGNLPAYPGLPVQRLHGGEPILSPTAHWWESGVTFNTAAVYLPRSEATDPLIALLLGEEALHDPLLADGVVATHYRARPRHDPGYRLTRSFTGLALFTPVFAHLLDRRPEPVLCPSASATAGDYLGIEDPRITQIGDTFYFVYCGVGQRTDARMESLHLSGTLARSPLLGKVGHAGGQPQRGE